MLKRKSVSVVLLGTIVCVLSGCPTLQSQYSADGINLYNQLPGASLDFEEDDIQAFEPILNGNANNATETLDFDPNGTVAYSVNSVQLQDGTYEIVSNTTAIFTLTSLETTFVLVAHGIDSSGELLVSVTAKVGTGQ